MHFGDRAPHLVRDGAVRRVTLTPGAELHEMKSLAGVELAYWSGLSQSEVASFLDIPLGTVKTRTRSALAHLADVLEGELA